MLNIALRNKPNFVCIVPEKRSEVTTEGGLNLNKKNFFLKKMIKKLKKVGIRVSLFVEPKISDIKTSKELGADCVEIHTGKISDLSAVAICFNPLFGGGRLGTVENEDFLTAALRELKEETNIENVELIKELDGTTTYELPDNLLGIIWKGKYRGQKQKWFLLRLISDEAHLNVSLTEKPEFDHWKWVSYWYPLRQVVSFKRQVYRRALKELAVSLVVEE